MSGPIEPGRLLDKRFRLSRLIGVGSMGEVWEANDEELGGQAAVKVLRREFLQEPGWKKRFQREAEIAQLIDSPYVARMLRAGTSLSARRPWIAFELVVGESLDAWLRRNPRPAFRDVEWMVADVLRGLDAVHGVSVDGVRIVHRDVKPANLLVESTRRRVRVLDFGIAKMLKDGVQTSGLTRIGEKLGTPSFMSPEQRASARNVDPRSDLYSAGCVAFVALTGRYLQASGDLDTDAPSLAQATASTWPEEMQGWINQMVAVNPDGRFASASAALRAWEIAVRSMAQHVAEAVSPPSTTEPPPSKTDLSPPSSR